MILGFASGESVLLIGPPGTAKTRLVNVFCHMLGLHDLNSAAGRGGNKANGSAHSVQKEEYFSYLLTPFTEPGELFGDFDIVQIENSTTLKRIEENTIQRAKVVYLDEVFNASSAILNSLLTLVNERRFHDRGKIKDAELRFLVGATNHIPASSELKAIFDRFLLRVEVHNVSETIERTSGKLEMHALLQKGWPDIDELPPPADRFQELLEGVEKLQQAIKSKTQDKSLFITDTKESKAFSGCLAQIVSHARLGMLSEMSNRRIIKMVKVMLVHAMLEAVRATEEVKSGIYLNGTQLDLIRRFALDRRDDDAEVPLISAVGSRS